MSNEFSFEERTTAQGVKMYVASLPHAHSVSAGVLIWAGTRDEAWPQEAGLAHAREHMDLQGSERFPTQEDLAGHIEGIGGELNAWTWKEMIFHWAQVPVSHSDRAFVNLSERLRKSLIPENKISTEMSNIVQEIHRAHDNPARHVWAIASQFLYGAHPLGHDTPGTEEAVKGFTRDDFHSFSERFYHPNNYIFLVAGCITADEALRHWEKGFPEISHKERNTRKLEPIVPFGSDATLQIERDIQQAHAVLAARIPGSTTGSAIDRTEAHRLDFFAEMVSRGMSSPLFQKVRNERGLCYEIHASTNRWSDIGSFNIYVGTDMERLDEAEGAIMDVLQRTRHDEERFKTTKEMILGALALETESTSQIISTAAQDVVFNGRPRDYAEIVAETEALSLSRVDRAVVNFLKADQFKKVVICPKVP